MESNGNGKIQLKVWKCGALGAHEFRSNIKLDEFKFKEFGCFIS